MTPEGESPFCLRDIHHFFRRKILATAKEIFIYLQTAGHWPDFSKPEESAAVAQRNSGGSEVEITLWFHHVSSNMAMGNTLPMDPNTV